MNHISQGKEKMPIYVNALNEERPLPFTFVTNITYPKLHDQSMSSGCSCGCDCVDGCSDFEDCSCKVKNGGEIPYNYKECVARIKPPIYECGPSCKCFDSCINRVRQHGIQFQLEVFRTKSKGWGVRSTSYILFGSFVCECK